MCYTNNGDTMEEKYIKLLLKRCLKVQKGTPLLISYNTINRVFVDKIVAYAKKLGVTDIYLDEKNQIEVHNILKNSSLKSIKENPLFDASIWDKYASKDAAFLMLESEIPNLMNDVSSKKLALAAMQKSLTKPLYKKRQLNNEIAWCIAIVPNELWARDIFKDEDEPLQKFWDTLESICMLNSEDPVKAWDEFLNKQQEMQDKLNALQIKKLHYKNSLGTDLTITLPNDALWASGASGKWIVNMPSYEIFTTPDYHETEGIVYASKPLNYSGKEIKDFNITFKKGKAVKWSAKEGYDVLSEIITGDKLSSYLGEAALVNYDSPISNTNKIFKTTLIDENAACHIALGSGFLECLKDSDKLDQKELDKRGINSSKNHVDFMIGTKDLTIEAETKDGNVVIMKNGNLII